MITVTLEGVSEELVAQFVEQHSQEKTSALIEEAVAREREKATASRELPKSFYDGGTVRYPHPPRGVISEGLDEAMLFLDAASKEGCVLRRWERPNGWVPVRVFSADELEALSVIFERAAQEVRNINSNRGIVEYTTVPSFSDATKEYTVTRVDGSLVDCTCPHFTQRLIGTEKHCKHMMEVSFYPESYDFTVVRKEPK